MNTPHEAPHQSCLCIGKPAPRFQGETYFKGKFGTVDLQSEWGVGTTVTLWVPVTSSDLVPALPQ